MRGNGGTMHNDVNDLVILKALKVKPRPAPPRSPIPVFWRPSTTGWIKINTDRSSQGAPGSLATGGVFRILDGSVLYCFHTEEGVGFAFLAELLAAITALEWARKLSLDFIWLEANFVYVVSLLSSRSLEVPWILKARRRAVLEFISSIHFLCLSYLQGG
ncbi:hypothetical protein C2S52_021251 [Perilla frutescens var. hirtella]|nr:hypothetical protein C2S52_021251 [Perilla frutescens var. hirtella]